MMRVIQADCTRQDSWDRYAAGHGGAAPYHRWAWLEAVRLAYGLAPVALMALGGETVLGILPLVRLKPPGAKAWLISLPYCDFGGPLADDQAVSQKLVEEALAVARSQGAAGVEIRRTDQAGSGPAKVLMRLALPEGSRELLDSFPAKLRSQVKKPLRDGLRAQLGGEELLEPFYQVLSRNMRDLGSPTHSLGWFQAVARGYGDRARLTVVFTQDGRPAAAGLTLVEGRTVYVPWASSLREFNRQNPNMLLYWTMLARAADRGLAEFDFGRSTPGQGTYNFKRQWGARELPLAWTRQAVAADEPRPIQAQPGVAGLRPLAEACWRRLPLGLANLAGPRLRRYISL